jgi:hypothetical protein
MRWGKQCVAQDEFLNDHGQLDGYYTSGSRERCKSLTSWRHATQCEMLKALMVFVPLSQPFITVLGCTIK